MSCGFTDVRQRADGSYYCSVCEKELGTDFRDKVIWGGGQEMAKKLDCQVSNSQLKAMVSK